MATLAVTHPTIMDLATRSGADGKITPIIEMVSQTNDILQDAVFIEANEPTGHLTTVRTGLPAPTWRKLYGGVQPSISRTAQVRDRCGMLEAYAEVDVKLVQLNGNTAAFRLSEDRAFIEGMNQELAQSVIYANEKTAPEEITGLTPRYNQYSAQNGDNIVTGGATIDSTDNSSIWLVVWGPDTVHMIYPKGTQAGLQVKDLGEVTIESVDGANGRMQAYRTHYSWDVGLSVRDWRYAVRIPINQEDLVADGATGPKLWRLMSDAINVVPNLGMGRPAFYMNRKVRGFLKSQMQEAVKSSTLTMEMLGGRPVEYFDGIPVRRCDAILNTESAPAA